MRVAFLAVLTVALAGCITIDPFSTKPVSKGQVDSTRPTCAGAADCKAKWEAAELWVAHNAGYKIRAETDDKIETYEFTPNDTTSLAVEVTKESLGDGRYEIVVHAWCVNMSGCYPDPNAAMLDFNVTVKRATP